MDKSPCKVAVIGNHFSWLQISRMKSKKNTFGWVRAEVLGALVNAVFLLALCFSIFIEAVKRLLEVCKLSRNDNGNGLKKFLSLQQL